MMRRLAWMLAGCGLVMAAAPETAGAQEWRKELRNCGFPTASVLDAPAGYKVLSAPSAKARVVREVPGPASVSVTNYVERNSVRYYLASWENESEWIVVPGTKRAEFIAASTPAKMIKKETRDFFKTGPETAEVYEETCPIEPVTEWGDDYRRAEIDFNLPLKLVSFKGREDGAWEAVFSVFPAFTSNDQRIPGPPPELYGEPHQVIITRPDSRETTLRGGSRAAVFEQVLLPGTVWAGGFSEGRLQHLRLGWDELQTPEEVSRLSPPHFSRAEPMSFRFNTTRLLETPTLISVTPDRVVGVDWTNYAEMAKLGGPYHGGEDDELHLHIQKMWNITLDSRLQLNVVAPLIEGRGAAGMLELEELGLGPSYEEELKALARMPEQEPPALGEPDDPAWKSIMTNKLGRVPVSQRAAETSFEN